MSLDIVYIVVGLLLLGYVDWYVPRTLRRVTERAHARGGNPERIDSLLASRLWRRLTLLGTFAGCALVLLGVVYLATGN